MCPSYPPSRLLTLPTAVRRLIFEHLGPVEEVLFPIKSLARPHDYSITECDRTCWSLLLTCHQLYNEVVEPKATEERRPSLQGRDSQSGATAERETAEDLYHRNLDEETERDIVLARERREANDRYFDRVNSGVLDVVAKLDEVAQAMRSVERESKDIWNDTDGMSSATPTTSHTG